jgi:arsenite methyltransferase
MKGSRSTIDPDATLASVRARYGAYASGGSCCSTGDLTSGGRSGPSSCSCCGGSEGAESLGYTTEELAGLPEGANLGLGCGNPTALLGLRPGQVVLDLGSGGGIDCFLAARKVGPKGHVIGVDMTPEMVAKARRNSARGSYRNVEFRLGEIDHLPAADASVDVVISNCVINLAPDKNAVYAEAFRVLRPGGVLVVSDVVATRPISAKDRNDPALWSSCCTGALPVRQIGAKLRRVGFREVQVELRAIGPGSESLADPRSFGVVPADIRAQKPG